MSPPGCRPEHLLGLRGAWAGAAEEWSRIGDPYERALELAEPGLEQPTLEGPRRAHRAPGRRARDARPRPDQRRDRRATGRVDPHDRPPRLGNPVEARRP